MIKSWSDDAWDDYLSWQTQDKRTLKKINNLIKDIERDPFNGIGKPEILKEDLSGKISRRINEKDRLVYKVEADILFIYSAKDHYS
ncbi:Txe/YoeB family addiction module toxin [Pseudolactococcus yaeyamensis]